MTKLDLATERHTSKQQAAGKTDSEEVVPGWHQGPKKLSSKEDLRRRYKKLFGFKPCDLDEKELERVVVSTEADRAYPKGTKTIDPHSRATIGDALNMKR